MTTFFISVRLLAASRAILALAFALFVSVLATSPATAAVTTPAKPPWHAHAAAVVEEEEQEEEAETEEEIEVELEFEEGEEEEESLPPECRLRTAMPRLVARFSHEDLRLTLHYTAETPLRASVSYGLKGSKGSTRLGSATRHLDKRGVLELRRRLDSRTLAKLRAARVIVVQLAVPNTPSYCKRLLTMHLTPRRPLRRSATWYEPA